MILASGSDDCTVKIWKTNMEHSIGIVNTAASVCSVCFHPLSRYHLAFGCADKKVYYYDLRDLRAPLCVLQGHKKTVSYCQFLNNMELVSLSIDGYMKLWNINTRQCLKSYHSHKNKKYFVGLAHNENYIFCGSENNSLYLYYKELPKNILKYHFSEAPGTIQPPDNQDTNLSVQLAVSEDHLNY